MNIHADLARRIGTQVRYRVLNEYMATVHVAFTTDEDRCFQYSNISFLDMPHLPWMRTALLDDLYRHHYVFDASECANGIHLCVHH
jgi:hypothetical protein